MQIYSYFVSKLLFFLRKKNHASPWQYKTGSTGQSTGLMVVELGMVASVTITHWIFQIEFSNCYTKYPRVHYKWQSSTRISQRMCVYSYSESQSVLKVGRYSPVRIPALLYFTLWRTGTFSCTQALLTSCPYTFVPSPPVETENGKGRVTIHTPICVQHVNGEYWSQCWQINAGNPGVRVWWAQTA